MLSHFPLSAPLVQSLLDNFFKTTTHNIYNGRSCLPDKKYLGTTYLSTYKYICTFCVKKLTVPVNFSM